MSLLFVTENLLDLDEDTMHWSESCGFSEDGFSQQPTTNFTQKPYALTQYESLNQTGELQDLLKRSEKHELSKNCCIFSEVVYASQYCTQVTEPQRHLFDDVIQVRSQTFLFLSVCASVNDNTHINTFRSS